MRVTKNARVVFRFPTCLIANFITAGIIRRSLRKKGVSLSRKQTRAVIKEFKRYKRSHKDWNLVEVFTPSGSLTDTVEVKL